MLLFPVQAVIINITQYIVFQQKMFKAKTRMQNQSCCRRRSLPGSAERKRGEQTQMENIQFVVN